MAHNPTLESTFELDPAWMSFSHAVKSQSAYPAHIVLFWVAVDLSRLYTGEGTLDIPAKLAPEISLTL